MDLYQQVIARSRYTRWLPEENRRETWEEAVNRYVDFFYDRFPQLEEKDYNDIKNSILNLEVMPSMRALATAGRALERDNVAGYNCAYITVDHPRAFDEACYILMCGTGVGFSVERQYINKMPEVAEEFNESETVIVVRDSRRGWASALRELIALLYSGKIPKWDCSRLRPAGARLRTFGGRSSGPGPLEELFRFTVETFKRAAGRKLNSLECHDLMCKVADIVVVGGVRRSALISLSNLTDERMRKAKAGDWWNTDPQRALANNSVCYTEKPDVAIFMKEWLSLMESKSGERGIFNRVAAAYQAGKSGRRDTEYDFGCNPCSEIILRPNQFCNLSEVVVRPTDTYNDLARKVRIATIIGTLQATLTDFRYLRKVWKDNCEEERLLGVSLTGIMDNITTSGYSDYNGKGEEWLKDLKQVAIDTNKEWSNKLETNPAAAITCVKPSGTVSQLVNSSSGIHPRFSDYYIRRIRQDKKDPITAFLQDQGIPWEQDLINPSNIVFSFPQKSPEGAVLVKDLSAIEQLEMWKMYQDNWCEHKPSCTVYVKDNEWLEAGAWVFNNFDYISGVSFLPVINHSYQQAPYEEVSKEKYEEMLGAMPSVLDWQKLPEYEAEDTTTSSHEIACAGGQCEI